MKNEKLSAEIKDLRTLSLDISEGVVQLRSRIQGRLEMNKRTSEIHPDPNVREQARLRYETYLNCISDLELVFGPMT